MNPIHRRLALLLIVPALIFLVRTDVGADMPDTFQNLKVLPGDISKDELKAIMNGFTEQLDVKCTFCHTLDEYHLDDNKHKVITREMIQLVGHLREQIESGTYFPEDTEPDKVGCWTCHRGSAEIESFVPPDDDEW